jgi:hypothetical protein
MGQVSKTSLYIGELIPQQGRQTYATLTEPVDNFTTVDVMV